MKKFVLKVILTFVAIVALAFVLNHIITNNLHKSSARLFQSWNDIFYGKMQCDALIMGSSRGFVQYDPAILDSAMHINSYNLSVDGRCIDAQVVKYHTYCQYNPKPTLIIQNVDFGTLELSNGYEREQFLPYFFCDTLFSAVKNSEGFSVWDRYLPLVRYAGYTQVIMEGLKLPNKLNHYPLYKGYYGRDDSWDGTMFESITSVEFCRTQEVVRIFDNFLAECKRDHIQVILVFAPIYIGVTEKMEDPQEMFDYYQSYADKYGFPLLNYTYDSLSYDTAYFYNATHLNKKGAILFSEKLAYDLNEILK